MYRELDGPHRPAIEAMRNDPDETVARIAGYILGT